MCDGRDNANPINTGFNHPRSIIPADPGNGTKRQFATPPDNSGEMTQAIQPDWRVRILLAVGFEDAAETDIIKQVNRCLICLPFILDREADDRIRAKQPPCIFNRNVLLADMNTGRATGQRHIHTVIDQQGHTERRQCRDQRPCRRDHLPGAGCLVPQLDKGHPACCGLPGNIDNLPFRTVRRSNTDIERQIEHIRHSFPPRDGTVHQ